LSGALEAESKLVVAPKVAGRIERLVVDLADPVERGQVVAYLDDAEFAQAVKQSEAELAVANANLAQAENALEISRRENQRVEELRERGIASDSEYDVAQAALLGNEAQLKVAEAQVSRATAALESARIRFGYTRVSADWPEGDSPRMVAERYLDEGETLSANDPLMLIVRLDPIVAVISVTERDYGWLRTGQEAQFRTDAFPDEVFLGRI
jgi:RND family efflux transporter MFP subunit